MKDVKSVLNGVTTVVFDLDGTLYDKSGLAHRMARHLWWCLPRVIAERRARKYMHQVQYSSEDAFFEAFFARMAKGLPWSEMRIATWYCDVYLPTMVRLIKKYQPRRPEVLALLDECKSRGLQMAIYSDYGSVVDKLVALDIDPQLFELKVSASSFGALKPSEHSARRVLELLHADPHTTLFVGDRDDKDGASARAVGAKFLLIDN